MEKFYVYNHSSENMKEIENENIDLIITDPPWNMGVKFGTHVDSQPEEEYQDMLMKIIFEMFRVIKKDGFCVVICANKIKSKNKIISLPKLYCKLFKRAGFNCVQKIPVNFKEPEKANWSEWSIMPLTEEGYFLVFSKTKQNISIKNENKTYYFDPKEGHPCTFTNKMVEDILDLFFEKGDSVLDPFMGTATLGAEVIRRGGAFFGYEIEKQFFETAKSKLRK